MVDRDDIGHLLNVRKSFKSFPSRHADHRASPDGSAAAHACTRPGDGQRAPIGRLLLSLREHKVTIVTRCNIASENAVGATGTTKVTSVVAGRMVCAA